MCKGFYYNTPPCHHPVLTEYCQPFLDDGICPRGVVYGPPRHGLCGACRNIGPERATQHVKKRHRAPTSSCDTHVRPPAERSPPIDWSHPGLMSGNEREALAEFASRRLEPERAPQIALRDDPRSLHYGSHREVNVEVRRHYMTRRGLTNPSAGAELGLPEYPSPGLVAQATGLRTRAERIEYLDGYDAENGKGDSDAAGGGEIMGVSAGGDYAPPDASSGASEQCYGESASFYARDATGYGAQTRTSSWDLPVTTAATTATDSVTQVNWAGGYERQSVPYPRYDTAEQSQAQDMNQSVGEYPVTEPAADDGTVTPSELQGNDWEGITQSRMTGSQWRPGTEWESSYFSASEVPSESTKRGRKR